MSRLVLLLLVAASCEGDHCDTNIKRCEGNTIVTCEPAGTKKDIVHKSNYYVREACRSGTHCIQVGKDVGCANPDAECDPTKFETKVAPEGNKLVVVSCTDHIGVAAYLAQSEYELCDPKSFKRTCRDGQTATACIDGGDLASAPALIRNALRGRFVTTLKFCSVCGDPEQCNN